MNRYIRYTHKSTDGIDNYLKTINLAAVSDPLDGESTHFGDEMASASTPRRVNSEAAGSGQKVDIAQPSTTSRPAPGNVPRGVARAQCDEHPAAGTRALSEETAQQASQADGSSGARKGSGRRQREKAPNQKHQRAAEARQRYELLEEERELLDNLADFWDERFDKPRRRRVPLPPWDVHKTYAPPAESDEEEAEPTCASESRSGRR